MGSFGKYLGIAAMAFGILVGPLVMMRVGGFSGIVAFFVLGVVPLGVGFFLFRAGSRQAKLDSENDERGFSEMALALAKKGGGLVGIDAVCKASGLPKDEAQARMRALTGTGQFELDFDANGQMVYKVSADAGAAQLASLAQKN